MSWSDDGPTGESDTSKPIMHGYDDLQWIRGAIPWPVQMTPAIRYEERYVSTQETEAKLELSFGQ